MEREVNQVVSAGSIVEFRDVSYGFSEGRPLFSRVNLSIRKGGYYLVQGPSGAGKSTFLRLINRLEEPLSGEILFRGRALSSYPPPLLRRSILYVQQSPTVIDASVRENLLMPFFFRSNAHLERPEDGRMKGLLQDFLLQGIGLGDNALTLSTGQLQRLCLIRGLLLSPEVLLLDEPASALDTESARVVQSMLERMNTESGVTALMVTHRTPDPGAVIPVILKLGHGRIKEEAWNMESWR
ncbi:MAG: ATP-binding cassette domain-containing protein [Deltaproteobacteria bacterium]|nr:ATP-binding cassette domain-containing protein [Deltaproteobacteria bacterium]MBW2049108.1 ATP-binding cassette domain-containing protein [Deltaproteobacteria bacterium]MBW2111037.1 ATP-binding cassette domain-containing protein [Deltaproteobacteria bacterium]MBW2354177.1 ATP-binding cassette domain-containing protein [Deltaproteobacteria bacterium]HDZ90978.1 ATP-binding cassette domain-containing protein [Deltaproteobacteria bacterium]